MFWFVRKPSGVKTLTVDTAVGSCTELDMRSFAGGVVSVTSGVTTLTLYGARETGGTYLPYKDKDNQDVTLTVADTQITQLPQEIYDLPFVKFVSNAAGTVYAALKS